MAVVDVLPVLGQEVGTGLGEPVGGVRAPAFEHADTAHELFEQIAEAPLAIGRIELVWRQRDGDLRELRGVEELAEVSDGVVVADAGAEYGPRHSTGAEEVDLRIGDDQRATWS
ncbi:hypothetical protein [Mycobacterium tilburgii]|uniref:hypothetical protein n=1 Tax=Mycobacterium tilburgii TaxID=44467 RepID=UPI001642E63A|nr:hypothetical protein [Mycobacterium tilburgii]